MDPFEAMKSMVEAWSKGTQSFAEAQRAMLGMTMPSVTMPGVAAIADTQAAQGAQNAFLQAWSNAQTISTAFSNGLGKGSKADPVAADVLAKVFDPRGWLSATSGLDQALNRMAEGPHLADLWSTERKFAAVFAAWIALRRRNLEHSTVMLEAWSKAAGAFAKAVNARADAGNPLESARDLMALWVETANDVLLETQRSEAFLASQRETLKASTDLRLAQQELGELYGSMFGYPTRSELDDVHRSLTELRREVRARHREKPAGRSKTRGGGKK